MLPPTILVPTEWLREAVALGMKPERQEAPGPAQASTAWLNGPQFPAPSPWKSEV